MRLVRYFFVGSAAALVDIGLFAVFARLLGYNYLIVAACTFGVATHADSPGFTHNSAIPRLRIARHRMRVGCEIPEIRGGLRFERRGNRSEGARAPYAKTIDSTNYRDGITALRQRDI